MRYLCLIYDAEQTLSAMPKAEREQMMSDYFAFTGDIRKKGHYVAGEALQPVRTATTVRVRHGQLVTTDGPFAETTEQLGGFYLIDARDLNEAIQVAAKIPSAKFGSIEVRPVVDFSASAVTSG
ncbi:MAG TPA: YciI family protein [Vicinamibacterales bacterium]|nr:YciI family protein [Vicinamibacterales bacterium]